MNNKMNRKKPELLNLLKTHWLWIWFWLRESHNPMVWKFE